MQADDAALQGAASLLPPAGERQSTLPSVAVVMPTHGPLARSARALSALASLNPSPNEIVIVADTPPTPLDRASLPPDSRLVEVPFRSGPARARNAGAAATASDVLLFIDADVEVPPDTVARVQAEFTARPEATALFGSYDDTPGDPGFLSQYRNLLHHFVHQHAQAEASTFWAGLGAVRAEAFRSAGGFDEGITQPSIEDIEFGCRLRNAGQRIRVVKDLQGRHFKRWTAGEMLKTDLFRRGVPWMRLILAQRRAPRDLNLDRTARWSTVLAGLALISGLWAFWQPVSAAVALACLLWLVLLNRRFYRFLAEKRGAWFALRSLPWHVIFYLECGLAALLGTFLHLGDRVRRSAAR